MALTLQVLYLSGAGTAFDHGYYLGTHMTIVADCIGRHLKDTLITRGVSGGADQPAGYHAVATLIFAEQDAMDAALAEIGPAVADIANFYDGQPHILLGEIIET